jgi:hypothetical protein
MKARFLAVPLFILVTSCGLKTSDMIDAKTVNSEIKNRKVIRITEGEKQEQAASISPLVMEDAERAFAAIVEPCTAVLDSILPQRWKPLKPGVEVICSDDNKLQGKARKVWDAYQEALSKGGPITGNFQKLPTNDWLISIPKDNGGKLALLNITLRNEGLSKWTYMVKTKQIASPAAQ